MSKTLSKKIYLLLCLLLCAGRIAYGQSVPVGTIPSYSRNCFNEYFTSISASGTNVISNTISVTGGTCSGTTWFNNYGSQGLVVMAGSQVSISFTRYTNTYSGYVSVYVDWNNDNLYSASELVGPAVRLSPTTLSGVQTFTVPSCISPGGNAHMRVMLTEIGDAVGTPASGNYGQAYDFYIRVSCPVLPGTQTVCMGTPKELLPGASCGSWSSSNPAVATVSSSGTVTGVAAGTAIMTYAPTSCTATYCTVTVQPPVSIAGSSYVCTGFITTLTGSPTGGTWTSSNPVVASISSSGVVSGASVGTATISYAATYGCTATKPMNVIPSLDPITGPSIVCPHASIVLANSTPGGTWSSSNPTVATVSASGGVVTAPGAPDGSGPGGTVTINYNTGFCGVVSKGISVKPANIIGPTTVCVGTSITLNGVEPGGTWSLATLGGAGGVTLNSSGVVTGLHMSGGDGIVYTSPSGCVVTKPMLADGAIITTASVCKGSTVTAQLASWIPSGGGPFSGIPLSPTMGTWSSSNPSIASVDPSTGNITGVAIGTCTITMTTPGGCVSTKVISVDIQPVSANSNVCTGNSITLPNSGDIGSWTGSNASASVTTDGIVAGNAIGTAMITFTSATFTGCKVIYPITVLKSPTVSGSGAICAGSTVGLSATPPGGTWSAGNAYASVSSSGLVTGLSAGAAWIVYTSTNGCAVGTTVPVNGMPVISGPSSVCTSVNLSSSLSGGIWTSSNTSLATVNSSGTVNGVSYGSFTISYTAAGCVGTYGMTSLKPNLSGNVANYCVSGTGYTLTAVPGGGSWNSSNSLLSVSGSGVSVGGTGSATPVVLTYTAGGCSNANTVTVYPRPTLTTAGGNSFAYFSVFGGTEQNMPFTPSIMPPWGPGNGIGGSGLSNVLVIPGPGDTYNVSAANMGGTTIHFWIVLDDHVCQSSDVTIALGP